MLYVSLESVRVVSCGQKLLVADIQMVHFSFDSIKPADRIIFQFVFSLQF